MRERVKGRRETVYAYNELEQLVGEVETIYEPVEAPAPEFAGVVGSLGLPHGQAPPEPVGEWAVYRVYEKVVVWLRRIPIKEAS